MPFCTECQRSTCICSSRLQDQLCGHCDSKTNLHPQSEVRGGAGPLQLIMALRQSLHHLPIAIRVSIIFPGYCLQLRLLAQRSSRSLTSNSLHLWEESFAEPGETP